MRSIDPVTAALFSGLAFLFAGAVLLLAWLGDGAAQRFPFGAVALGAAGIAWLAVWIQRRRR